jgi:hypothetical protein
VGAKIRKYDIIIMLDILLYIWQNSAVFIWRKTMYKYLLFIAIIALCSCQKQVQNIAEENEKKEIDTISIMAEEEPIQEDIIEPAVVAIISNKYSEDIVGAWWMTAVPSTIEIEFTNDDILYIREYDYNLNFVDGKFYPYRIEGYNLIIDDTGKSNNFRNFINSYLLPSGDSIPINELDARRLVFMLRESQWTFYKGSVQELLERRNISSSYENKLKDFIYNEILNGTIFQGDIEDEDGVIDTYGEPLNDEIIEYSDGLRYEGGRTLIGIREITYEDITHRYFVFINRSNIQSQFYKDVIVNKKLDTLTTINIGATSEDIRAVFGNSWRKEGEDLIYMWGGDGGETYRWVRFSIENGIVISISYILTSWD